MSLNKIQFNLSLFENPADKARSRKCVLWLMEALVQINKTYITSHNVPPLYKTDVIYKIEDGEYWKDIANILKDGWGDCEDLACYRIAELQSIGIAARPYIKWRKIDNVWVYHALVWRPGNKIEDPSLALGMHGGKIVRKPLFVKP